jgi:hypothetical protein
MRASMDLGYGRLAPGPAGRSVWIVLIVTSGTCLSPFFACVTPFAALATLAAVKLGRRDAIAAVGLVWLTNQAIGYGLLGYPLTWDSAAWGLTIGASSGLAILAARGLYTTNPVPLQVSLPFIAAFAVFELGLYAAGLVLPGADGAFTASVVGHVFLINAVALCGLVAVYHLAIMSGLLPRNDGPGLLTVGRVSYR